MPQKAGCADSNKVKQDFIGQGHYGKVKGQIKVRP